MSDFEITIVDCPDCKRGFKWAYNYTGGQLTAISLCSLKKKVLSLNLKWEDL